MSNVSLKKFETNIKIKINRSTNNKKNEKRKPNNSLDFLTIKIKEFVFLSIKIQFNSRKFHPN